MKQISRRAFSLVEVVLALGVVSFAVLTLLALIPNGMGNFQKAQTNNVETQIVQQVNNELQNAPYSTLFDTNGAALSAITEYRNSYDMEGELVTNAASENPVLYTVTLNSYLFTNISSSGVPSSLTNSTGQALAQTVQINVNCHNQTNTFTTLIVNKGY